MVSALRLSVHPAAAEPEAQQVSAVEHPARPAFRAAFLADSLFLLPLVNLGKDRFGASQRHGIQPHRPEAVNAPQAAALVAA